LKPKIFATEPAAPSDEIAMKGRRDPRFATHLHSGRPIDSRSPYVSETVLLLSRRLGLVAVVLDVCLGRFRAVVDCVVEMPLRAMGVMSGCFVGAQRVMLGGFAMMPRGVLVMFGCLVMMLNRLLGHRCSPLLQIKNPTASEANGSVLLVHDNEVTGR
jgi:hypothetical protein